MRYRVEPLRRRVSSLSLLVSLIALGGCGGDRVSGAAAASKTSSISGIVHTAKFTVPAGNTVIVTGNTIIDASDTIQIDGTILVNKGVGLALLADNAVHLAGTIRPNPSSKSTISRLFDLIRSEAIAQNAPSPYVVGGKEVDALNKDGQSNPSAGIEGTKGGQGIDITTRGNNG